MSETATVPPIVQEESKRQPTVYFIDDSATMREVIKIAFRRENINVITCADAAAALGQFEQHPPDVVITDVIMPDTDSYSLCSQVKQHPQFGKTPVILMSGVVNKSVADRAVAVQASELVRKPFQPQELIGRVRNLLAPAAPPQTEQSPAASSLNSLFAPPPAPPRAVPPPAPAIPQPVFADARPAESTWTRALADAFNQPAAPMSQVPTPAAPPAPRVTAPGVEVHKLRAEISRLELLIKKLQTELQIERQYNQALELQVRALTQID
jgi:twitching motility two-component system response regulator PilH